MINVCIHINAMDQYSMMTVGTLLFVLGVKIVVMIIQQVVKQFHSRTNIINQAILRIPNALIVNMET